MDNKDLARVMIAAAGAAGLRRRACLCAATALQETKTVAAARRVLAEHGGMSDVMAGAIAELNQITAAEITT